MAEIGVELDAVFSALANPTRRAVVERLGAGSMAVSALAEPFGMALPSFLQHLKVLEACGLVASEKRGRVRTVRIVPGRLLNAGEWLMVQRSLWERRLDQLDAQLLDLEDS